MSSISYLALELATLVLFALTWWHATQRGARIELVSAVLFGLLLELGQMTIFNTYHYSERFWFMLGPAPLIIGLCWGIIIYGAMAYSDQLGLVAWAAPFADALWALLLDLSFDAIAIRLGFWSWAIPLEAGYFGVPAENFIGWLAVAFGFSALTRRIRRQRDARLRAWLQFGVPLIAYALLWSATIGFRGLVALLPGAHAAAGEGMMVVVALIILFAMIVASAVWRVGLKPRRGIDLIPTLCRWSMHGYYLSWAVLLLIAPWWRLPGMDLPPFLIGMALLLLVVETLMLLPLLHPHGGLRAQARLRPVLTQEVTHRHRSAAMAARLARAGDS